MGGRKGKSNMKTPYRSPGEVPPALPAKPVYGFIKAPPALKLPKEPTPKKHFCKRPSWITHLLHFFRDDPIRPGSLFRCQCGQVFEYRVSYWWRCGEDMWLKKGGELE